MDYPIKPPPCTAPPPAKSRRWPLLVLAVLVIALFYGFFGCPIRYFTGISCPGCGMTRAVWALLQLDFKAALHYHPLVFILPIPAAILLARKRVLRTKRRRQVFTAAMVGLFLVVYFYRLLFAAGDVVSAGVPPFWREIINFFRRK